MGKAFEEFGSPDFNSSGDNSTASKIFEDAYARPRLSRDDYKKLPFYPDIELNWENISQNRIGDLLRARSEKPASSEEVFKAAENLAKRKNPKMDALNDDERMQAQDLELAILRGNLDKFAAKYKDNPELLKKLVDAVKDDVKAAGLDINCQVGRRSNGDEFHPFAIITLNKTGAKDGVEISTDLKGIETYDGGLATIDDGAAILKRMGNQAVRTLNKGR